MLNRERKQKRGAATPAASHWSLNRRSPASVACVGLLLMTATMSTRAAIDPDSGVVGVTGPNAKTAIALTLQVAALEARIKKLEGGLLDVQRSLKKADVSADDDGGAKDGAGKKSPGGSAGSSAASPADGGKPAQPSGDAESAGMLKDVFPTMTLRAPFVVVDASGKPIFRVNDPRAKNAKSVGDRGVYVYGDSGAMNFAMTTVYAGGKLFVQSDSGAHSTSLGALDKGAGLMIRADNKARAYIGLDNQRKGFVGVYAGSTDQPIAGLQSTDADKGLVAVFNAGTPVAFLSQSGAHPGGGNVTITDPGGNGIFSAGFDGSGGSACVNHNQALHCLGIGLPLGGGQ